MIRAIIFFLFLLSGFLLNAQDSTFSTTSSDGNFTMSVSRAKGEVTISVTFNDSLVFDYAAIERLAGINKSYSQCKYITYDEVRTKGRHIVKKDIYPFPEASDVFYRLRLVTNDGPIRTYPPIRLPAVTE